jgi:predicted TIM-barrel fold metal-dependent hydrolase
VWQDLGKPHPNAVIDIHQHSPYARRDHAATGRHQAAMGVSQTVLLSAGAERGLDVCAGSNDDVRELAESRPESYVWFAKARPDLPNAPRIIERCLRAGARGIGELKFPVDCDSIYIRRLADVAREFRVPVLFHFEFDQYSTGFDRFHAVLEAYPTVNFIGHAQTWWGHIDADHKPWIMHPKTRVAAGGLTDRLLASYPNLFGDLSARSGLNALLRDEEHARGFLARHQNQLLYGSDCDDSNGHGDRCSGAQCLAALRRLAPDAGALRKIAYGNAYRLLTAQAAAV